MSDTGVGMDADTQARIFEPFFTTKAADEGTGLGLATVYGIMRQSGGGIWVYSEPGLGSVFRIYLPRLEDEGNAITAAPAPPPPGSETVLLVEDDEAVRQTVAVALREQGYRVLEAAGGEQALAVAAAHAGPLHLLLTDVVMRGLGGLDLWPRLQAARPGVRGVFMSGYSEEIVQRQGDLPAGTAFVQKPIDYDELFRRMRELLEVPDPPTPA